MSSTTRFILAIVAGAGLGAAAMQELSAQTKPKAYSITENELIDATAQKAYTPLIQAAQKAAGGRNMRTAGGRVVGMIGAAPQRISIVEWDSLEQAQAFFNSKAFTDLAPQREKAVKTNRRFVVEALN